MQDRINNFEDESQVNPIINHNHDNIADSKVFKNEKPSQDEIKEFLIKVKELIPIKDFKRFIDYI